MNNHYRDHQMNQKNPNGPYDISPSASLGTMINGKARFANSRI